MVTAFRVLADRTGGAGHECAPWSDRSQPGTPGQGQIGGRACVEEGRGHMEVRAQPAPRAKREAGFREG